MGPLTPDVQIIVNEQISKEGTRLEFQVSGRLPEWDLDFRDFGSVVARDLNHHRERILKFLKPESKDDQDREKLQLEDWGRQMFSDFLPPALQARLKDLAHEIQSIRVIEKTPWIPWSLLFTEPDTGPGFHWGARYSLGGRTPGPASPPFFKISRAALLMAGHLGNENPYAAVFGRISTDVIPLSAQTLRETMRQGEYDLIHVEGGDNSELQGDIGLYLEDGRFGPENIALSPTLAKAPLVFFNGFGGAFLEDRLQSGTSWGSAFLERGALAFIGSYWDVPDEHSQSFANAFYARLLAGMPLGFALSQTVAEPGSVHPAYALAYHLYGHPLAYHGDYPLIPKPPPRAERAGKSPVNEPPPCPAPGPTHVRQHYKNIRARGDLLQIGVTQSADAAGPNGYQIEQKTESLASDGSVTIIGLEIK